MGVVSKKQARSAQLIEKHYPQLQEPENRSRRRTVIGCDDRWE